MPAPRVLDRAPSAIDQVRARVRADGLTVPDGRRSARRALGAAAVHALLALGALAVDTWWGWMAAWLLMGVAALGAPAALHEWTHGTVARRPAANRLGGLLAGALMLLPASVYRSYHLAHHAGTATGDDPEGDPLLASRLQYPLLPVAGFAFWVELWAAGIRTLAGRPPTYARSRPQRRALQASTVATAALLAVAVWAATVEPLVWRLWLAPLGVLTALLPFVLLPEHYGAFGAPRRSSLEITTTVRSNPLVAAAFWNANLHAAHHLVPRVPGHHLPTLDALVAPLQHPGRRARSYTAWHRATFSALPWRAVPLTTPTPPTPPTPADGAPAG